MKVSYVSSTNFGANIRIKSADNNKHKFLYNEMIDFTRYHGIPANFRTHEIELPSVSVEILQKLNKLKIKFYSGKKH